MVAVVVGVLAVCLVPVSMLLLGRGVKRRGSLEAYAAARRFRYFPVLYGLGRRWPGPPFGDDPDVEARHVVEGHSDGRAFFAFDQVVPDGEGGAPSRTGVYVLLLPAALPSIEIRREWGGRMTDAVGLTRTVELESEDFNRTFRVGCADRRFASDVLTPRAMEAMLGLVDHSFRIGGDALVTWSPSIISPERVDAVVAALGVIADSLGDHVWRTYGRET